MAGLMRREPREEAADVFGRFERLFDEWMRLMPFRPVPFSHWKEAEDFIRVEEFREDGTLVIRADLPGIDPEKDAEVTVSDGMLRIEAERRAEEKQEEEGYLRQEVHYGSLSRSLPLPAGHARDAAEPGRAGLRTGSAAPAGLANACPAWSRSC
jgi:HSP20 family protein